MRSMGMSTSLARGKCDAAHIAKQQKTKDMMERQRICIVQISMYLRTAYLLMGIYSKGKKAYVYEEHHHHHHLCPSGAGTPSSGPEPPGTLVGSGGSGILLSSCDFLGEIFPEPAPATEAVLSNDVLEPPCLDLLWP